MCYLCFSALIGHIHSLRRVTAYPKKARCLRQSDSTHYDNRPAPISGLPQQKVFPLLLGPIGGLMSALQGYTLGDVTRMRGTI